MNRDAIGMHEVLKITPIIYDFLFIEFNNNLFLLFRRFIFLKDSYDFSYISIRNPIFGLINKLNYFIVNSICRIKYLLFSFSMFFRVNNFLKVLINVVNARFGSIHWS